MIRLPYLLCHVKSCRVNTPNQKLNPRIEPVIDVQRKFKLSNRFLSMFAMDVYAASGHLKLDIHS
jgi:hypothetical protein